MHATGFDAFFGFDHQAYGPHAWDHTVAPSIKGKRGQAQFLFGG